MSGQFYSSRRNCVAFWLALPSLTCVGLAGLHISAYPLAAWIGAFVVWLSMQGRTK